MNNKRRIGTAYESRVAEELSQRGYQILRRNFYCRFGEIDLICKKDDYLVFLEVKYRSSKAYGLPQEAVDARKQKRISNSASYYLYSHHLPYSTPCRFDVAAVSGDSIQIIENAFPYRGYFQ